MPPTVSDDRITVYQIPEGTLCVWCGTHDGEAVYSETKVPAGLYVKRPGRAPADRELMRLFPVERCSGHGYVVQVADVARFARNYVPEGSDNPSCPAAQEPAEPEDRRRAIIRLACEGLEATLDSDKDAKFLAIVQTVLGVYEAAINRLQEHWPHQASKTNGLP